MIHFVGAGPGAPDLITVRGQRLLAQAVCVIYAGSLVNPQLLESAKAGCRVLNSAAMTLEEARRGLCPRSGGDSRVCRSDCPAPCRIGRWVISLEDAARIPSRHVAVMAQR